MAFRVGQKVVCINAGDAPGQARGLPWYPGSEIFEKRIYTVRAVGLSPIGTPGIKIHEATLNACVFGRLHRDTFYHAGRFRPVVERKTDTGFAILTEILNGQRVPEVIS